MESFIVLVGNRQDRALKGVIPVLLPVLAAAGNAMGRWLHDGIAYEFGPSDGIDEDILREVRHICFENRIDVFVIPEPDRRKKLLLADMDATIVCGETLDDLAELAGLGEEISDITAQAMRGELDFEEALRARVAMLKGVSESLLFEAFSRMELSAGAEVMVRVMRQAGAECVLVSGGFTFFTSRIAERCGFSLHHGNELDVFDGVLTGEVIPPILDKGAKLSYLHKYASRLGLDLSETAAVGDGANDLPMLEAAGIGVGYRPKPLVLEKVSNSIIFSDLISLLYMQGYGEADLLPFLSDAS